MRAIFSANCPCCGAEGQSIAWWKCLKQRATTSCKHCDRPLESELKISEYLAVCILGTVLAMVIGWMLVVALLNEFWELAAVAATVTFGPLVVLGMIFHARRLRPAAPIAGRVAK